MQTRALTPVLHWASQAASNAAAGSGSGLSTLSLRQLSSHGAGTSSAASDQVQSAFAFCVQQVRTYDNDNYVWMVQLPKALRRPVFALRAFNIETALVAEHVQSKEAPLLQIRFQWWRDSLDALYGGATYPKHPVLTALGAVLEQQQAAASAGGGDAKGATRAKISKYNLKKIIDTREADMLDAQPPLSIDGLEKYAEGTASQLLYLQLGAAGVASREADHAASHLGKAVGIATLLKGTAYHARMRRSYLPLDLCAEHGVSQEDVYSGTVSEGLRDVTHKVASVAKAHLDEARALKPSVPEAARPLLLPSVACLSYLQALEKCEFDPYHPSLAKGGVSPLWHVLQIKWHLLYKSY